MDMPPLKEPYDGYCGTSYAAKMLGISVGTVQGLVEKNDLKAWKTQGGIVVSRCSPFKTINAVITWLRHP